MKLSVVIRVYNEAQTVREVIERVLAVDLGAIERETSMPVYTLVRCRLAGRRDIH